MQSENFVKIKDLAPLNRELFLKAKVLELGEKREVTNRNTGEEHEVMEILLGDETGVVYFSAWNEDIDRLEVGKTYEFRDVKTILFRGHVRLSLGRNGSFEEIDEDIEEINTDFNVSEEEHEFPRRNRYNRGGYNDRRRNNYRSYY